MKKAKPFGVFSFWKHWSLKVRLTLVFGALAVIGFVVIARFSLVMIEQEKKANIARLATERALSLSVAAQTSVLQHTSKRQRYTLNKDTVSDFKKFALPRWPTRGELYAGLKDGRATLFGREQSGDIWFAPFEGVGYPWRSLDSISYWYTAQGTFLGSNSALVKQDNFTKRLLYQLYESSAAQFGGDYFRPAGGPVFAAFREVPATNIVVATEFLIDFSVESVVKISLFVFAVSVIVLLLSFFAAGLFSRTVVRPLNQVLSALKQFSVGNFQQMFGSTQEPELMRVIRLLDDVGGVLQTREKNFETLSRGLKRLLEGSRDMTVVQDRHTVTAIAASIVMANVGFSSDVNAWVYLLSADQSLNPAAGKDRKMFLTAQLAARGRMQSGALTLDECVHSANPAQVLLQTLPYIDDLSKLVFVPVVHSEKSIGFFVFEGFLAKEFSEFERMFLEGLATSVGVAIRNIQLIEDTRSAALLESERLAIQTVQDSLLSRGFPIDEVNFQSHFSPAETMGGDWYHFKYSSSDETLYVFIGDVTGHGIPAAIMTAVAFGAIRSAEREVLSDTHSNETALVKLNAIAESANEIIFDAGQGRLFMTMLFTALHVPSGKLSVLSAGHPPLHVLQSGAHTSVVLSVGGTPLGSEAQGRFEETTYVLQPGDGYFMFTDGLVENIGPDERHLTKRDMKDLFGSGLGQTDVLPRVLQVCEGIWQDTPKNDDVTALLCWWNPRSSQII